MKSPNDISLTRDLEGAKSRISALLKKRKKMSNFIKAFELEKLGQMLKLEVTPSEFEVSGQKVDRIRT